MNDPSVWPTWIEQFEDYAYTELETRFGCKSSVVQCCAKQVHLLFGSVKSQLRVACSPETPANAVSAMIQSSRNVCNRQSHSDAMLRIGCWQPPAAHAQVTESRANDAHFYCYHNIWVAWCVAFCARFEGNGPYWHLVLTFNDCVIFCCDEKRTVVEQCQSCGFKLCALVAMQVNIPFTLFLHVWSVLFNED